jgi:hypothetical protein
VTSENGGLHPNGSGAAPVVEPFPAPPMTAPEPQASAQAQAVPEDVSPETMIFRSGLITPDQLGELVEQRVRTGRPAHEIVVERGWVDYATVAGALGLEAPEPSLATASTEPAPVVLAAADPFALTPAEPAPMVPAAAPVDPFALMPAPAAEPLPVEPYVPAPTFPTVEAPVELVVEPAFPPAAEESQAPTSEPEPAAETPTPAARVEFCLFVRFAGNERVHLATFSDADDAKEAARAAAEQIAAARDGWPFLGGRFVRPDAVLSIDVDAVVR